MPLRAKIKITISVPVMKPVPINLKITFWQVMPFK